MVIIGTLDNDDKCVQLPDVTALEMYLFFGHNNTSGTWCHGHSGRLLVNSGTVIYTFLQQQNETW